MPQIGSDEKPVTFRSPIYKNTHGSKELILDLDFTHKNIKIIGIESLEERMPERKQQRKERLKRSLQ